MSLTESWTVSAGKIPGKTIPEFTQTGYETVDPDDGPALTQIRGRCNGTSQPATWRTHGALIAWVEVHMTCLLPEGGRA
jgi:hypothetical protein